MSENQDEGEERPCLHCFIAEVIDEFFAEYPATADEPDTGDTAELIVAVGKTVAELTFSQDGAVGQKIIQQLMRATGSDAWH
jgi:hypothetical protein